MTNIIRLQELQEQKRRRAHLETLRRELTKEQEELTRRETDLRAEMEREQRDVDSLQKPGVKSLLYGITGKKAQKLESEQAEARDARMKYEAALRDRADVEYRLHRVDGELAELDGCASEYEALVTEVLAAMTDTEAKREIEALTCRVHSIQAAKNEIHRIFEDIDCVREHLVEAQKKAVRVQYSGESTESIKYDELRDARRIMNQIEERLAALKPALCGIGIETNIKYYAKLLSNYNDDMMGGVGLLQMIKHVHGQNNGTKTALEEIKERLDTAQQSAERELDDRIMKLMQ